MHILSFGCKKKDSTMNIKKSLLKATLAATVLASGISAKDYSGAELYTNDTFQYGKFEARMMMASGSGLVGSMFLYHNDSYMGGDEPWVEIDMEVLGKNTSQWQSNIITGKAGAQVTSEKKHAINPSASESYHTYGIEWTPSYVTWTIDGSVVRKTMTDSSDTKAQVQALVRAQGLRFNLWSSEESAWVGSFDDSMLPVHQFISWVKVYSYTPGAGENGSDFTLDWTDNFESFDGSRWGCGNWTFDGNRVDMNPDNINIVDGTMVISLTKAGEEGFYGTVPMDSEDISPEPQNGVTPADSSPEAEPIDPQGIRPARASAPNTVKKQSTFDAKGARVGNSHRRFQINFRH